MANSRGPASLVDLIAELGPFATVGTVEQAVAEAGVVVLSVPLTAQASFPATLFASQVELDTTNHYPF